MPVTPAAPTDIRSAPRAAGRRPGAPWRGAALLAAAMGPGLLVMLADTDAGSIVTAAQSGATWGYRMVLPQVLLIPFLYGIQELSVRLGIATGRGHAELIRGRFGVRWAALSVATLVVAVIGALVTELAAIAAVGALFGLPAPLAVGAAACLLIALGVTGGYRRVERVGLALGLFELLFLPAAVMAHPSAAALLRGLASVPIGRPGYLFLLAANVGAVIMPWMVFYQQAAVVDKGLRPRQLRHARLDTLIGAVLTQLIMIFVVVAAAATLGRAHPARPLGDIRQVAAALQPFLGEVGARFVFGLGMLGAAFVAALVVSLAGAWAVGEALGVPHSLNDGLHQGRWFYLAYALMYVASAALVLSGIPPVTLTVDVEVMNAVLLPVVLGFLLALEAKVLPVPLRLRRWPRLATWGMACVVMAFGLFMAVYLVV